MSYDIIFVFRSLRATNLSIEVEPEDIFGNYDKTHIYAKESKSILNGNSVFFPILTGERFGDCTAISVLR
jgi:predicted amidohydrolase